MHIKSKDIQVKYKKENMKKDNSLLKEYRVVTDQYCGFEVQRRYKGFFGYKWSQPITNTHASLEDAMNYIEKDIFKRTFKSVQVWP